MHPDHSESLHSFKIVQRDRETFGPQSYLPSSLMDMPSTNDVSREVPDPPDIKF